MKDANPSNPIMEQSFKKKWNIAKLNIKKELKEQT
jgi:hypothetical protein